MFELRNIQYSLPGDVERALILAPHPDDETIGCGGTMALYAERISFTVVALSNGEAVNIQERDRAELRQRELKEATQLLGVGDIVFLDIPDEGFGQHREEMKQRLSEVYRHRKPDMVFAPSPFDIHPDHETTARVCIELNEIFPDITIAFYEVYNPGRFTTLIDIGSVVDVKREALKKYHYSMLEKEDIFIQSVLSLNRARSVFPMKDSLYEAFWISGGPEGVFPLLPEDRFLSEIRTADTLIHRLRSAEAEVPAQKERLSRQEREIQELTRKFGDRGRMIDELKEKLTVMEGSLFWRMGRRFYSLRDILLPEGAKRRSLYDRIISILKRADP